MRLGAENGRRVLGGEHEREGDRGGSLAGTVQGRGVFTFAIGVILFATAGGLDWPSPWVSPVVRIQHDRGHVVVDRGPYRLVRHPGYLGAILASLATPLVLEALWALVPGGLVGLVTVLRTLLEDRTLKAELPRYREYARRVRYRLLPGLW